MTQSFDTLIAASAEKLTENGFRVVRDASLPDNGFADLAASRNHFSWKGLVLLSQHLLIKRTESATVASMKAFYEQAFRYGKQVDRVPLCRGMQFGFMIIPCLVTEKAEQALIDYVTARPPKRFAVFEFPVVHELSSGNSYFYSQTAIWGAFYFSDMRELAKLTFKTA